MAATIVQAKGAGTAANATSLAVVFASAPTQNNQLFAWGSADALLTMASSGWTLVGSEIVNFTALDQWTKTAGAGESSTVTINIGASTTAELIIAEVSGLTASPLDKNASNNPGSNAASIASGTTAALAQADEICFACCSYNDSTGTAAILSSWSNSYVELPLAGAVKGVQGTGAGMDTWLGVGYRIVAATTAQTSTATLPDQGGRPIGAIATYKIAAAAAAHVPALRRPTRGLVMRRGVR